MRQLCFQLYFNLPEDPPVEIPRRTRERARRGFCWGATACRATSVGLGLSLATVWQQELGPVTSLPVDMEALLL